MQQNKIKTKIVLILLVLFTLSGPALGQHLDKEEVLPAVIGTLVFLGVAVLIILFIFGFNKFGKKTPEIKREYYDRFALSHGFGFHEKDTFGLAQELEGTLFQKRTNEPGGPLVNILTHSDHNSDCYIFHRYISSASASNTVYAYTVCFFKIKKDFGLNLRIKARSPAVFEKAEHPLEEDNLKEVRIPGYEDFNKEFIVYCDIEAIAVTLIDKRIIEYCRINRKRFITPEMIYTEIKNNKLIIYAQYRGSNEFFRDESRLAEFVNLAKGLKEKFTENI